MELFVVLAFAAGLVAGGAGVLLAFRYMQERRPPSPPPQAPPTPRAPVVPLGDILEQLPIVALPVGPDLKVEPGFSKLARELLGRGESLRGRDLVELVYPSAEDGEKRRTLEDWLRLVFEQPDMDWETVRELCPLGEIKLAASGEADPAAEERTFRLALRPCRAGPDGPVVRLVVTGADVTTERTLAQELDSRDEEGRASVERLAEILKLGAETFRRFLNECYTRLAEIEGSIEKLREGKAPEHVTKNVFRQVHTLKANAQAFRLSWIARMAESAEDALSELKAAEDPAASPALETFLGRMEALRVLLEEAEDLGSGIFGRALDPGEVRVRERDLEIPVRVGRLESALALVRGARAVASQADRPERSGELLRRLEGTARGLLEVPARHLFQRFPKMLADLAAMLGKKVEPLRVTGSEILVNIRVLDKVGDALVHLLRNAVSHGIEPREERLDRGKPEAGRVELSLVKENGKLVFEVADDGAGIDRDELARHAKAAGLSVEGEEGRPDDLVFRPGLSTAEAGPVSGRGMGFESMKAAVEFLDGAFEVRSRPGEGTRVRVIVPSGSGT